MRCPACGKELTTSELKTRQCTRCGLRLPVVSSAGEGTGGVQSAKLPDLPWKKSGIYKDDSLPPPQRTKVVPIKEVDAMEGETRFKKGEIDVTPPPVPLDAPVEGGGIVTDAPVENASLEDKRLIGAAPPPPPPPHRRPASPAAGPSAGPQVPPPTPGPSEQIQPPVGPGQVPQTNHPPVPPAPPSPSASQMYRGEPTMRVRALPPPPPPPGVWDRYGTAILVMVAFVAAVMAIAGILLMAGS